MGYLQFDPLDTVALAGGSLRELRGTPGDDEFFIEGYDGPTQPTGDPAPSGVKVITFSRQVRINSVDMGSGDDVLYTRNGYWTYYYGGPKADADSVRPFINPETNFILIGRRAVFGGAGEDTFIMRDARVTFHVIGADLTGSTAQDMADARDNLWLSGRVEGRVYTQGGDDTITLADITIGTLNRGVEADVDAGAGNDTVNLLGEVVIPMFASSNNGVTDIPSRHT